MVHVICADISHLGDGEYEVLYQCASRERQARADRYRRREDALRCLASDALLRRALGTGSFTVCRRESGKPYLADRPEFHYNLSHSGNWVVLAYGGSEVGVDVEALREDVKFQAMARRFFSEEERQYVGEDRERFFRVWTGKESYVKYLGTGLKTALDSFSVLSLEPQLYLHYRNLDGAWLCLCTREKDFRLEAVDGRELLEI